MFSKVIKLILTVVLFSFMSPVNAQKREIEEDPLSALRWFYEMRKDNNEIYSEGRRWEAYLDMRNNTLNKSSAMITANWESIGPNTIDSLTGRMISHAFDPTDNNIIWAGSANGGLWKSTNAGELWQSVANDIPTLEISEVTINPANRDEMLIGTGVDRGQSVTLRSGIGVLKSTDRGLTWTLTSFSYNLSNAVAVSKIIWHPIDQNLIYMAASNGFWASTDGGDNWSVKRVGRVSDIEINPASPNIIYAAFRQEGIYKSIDGGENWNALANGLPSGPIVGLTSLTLCDSQPDVLYTSIANSNTWELEGFFKTIDGGNTWSEVLNAPNVLCNPGGNTSCIGWFVNKCEVSPLDPDLVFLAGIQMWRSDNGGMSWTWHDYFSNGIGYDNSGLVYVDTWDIGFDPVELNTIYFFNDGGIQKSTNGGLWWEKKNKGLVTAHIYRIASAPNDTTILVGGFQDHGLQKLDSNNGNTTWTRWSIDDGTQVIIHPSNSQIFYGSFFFGVHVKNSFGGENWLINTIPIQNGITESGKQFAPLEMDIQNPNTLYTTSVAKIYKTTNGGSFWNAVANILNIYTIAIDQVNSNIIYAHSYTGSGWSIWRSDDAGSNWTGITHSSIPTWRVVDLEADPSNEGVVYAVRNSAFQNSDHVKRSTDYGETWTNITNNLPDITCSAIAISPYNPEHLYLATDLGVFVSTNSGAQWDEYNDGLPLTYVSDIHYHPMDRTLRISTIGRGAYKTKAVDANITIVEGNNENIPNDFIIYNNYPNPFNPTTNINFEITKPGNIQVNIYDELGQQIRELINKEFSVGFHKVAWDGKNEFGMSVSSGTYYARIIKNGIAKSIKMILMK